MDTISLSVDFRSWENVKIRLEVPQYKQCHLASNFFSSIITLTFGMIMTFRFIIAPFIFVNVTGFMCV